MKKILLRLFVGLMNFIYLFYRPLRRKNRVTFVSRQSNSESLDFRLLREELEKDGTVEVRVLTRKLDKGAGNAWRYFLHMFSQMHCFATSRVVVTDSYCILLSILRHGRGLKVIQIWHAVSAVKQFGWQTVGRADGSSPLVAREMKMHNNYDHILSASDVTATSFCKAFGYGANAIVKIGLPRIDYIKRPKPETREAILARYPELADSSKKNVLYVPTMRKGRNVDVNGIIERLDLSRFNLIVRLHPLENNKDGYIKEDGVFYDEEFNSYDLLEVADMVVSDYSSYVVEASLLDIPLYLYVYDIEEYKENTGLNVDFSREAIGKYAFTDCGDLVAAFDEPYDLEALRTFRNKYIDIDTTDCTKQLADFIMRLINGTEKSNI